MGNITITAERPAYGGASIGYTGGKVVMVAGAIPGETVEARVDQEKKDYTTATTLDVITPSPDRVAPGCRYYGVCGGCQSQHISYERQVKLKQEVLSDCIRRIAGIDTRLSPPLVHDAWGYRHRGQFKVSGGVAGFFKARSRDVVSIESCPVVTGGVNTLLKAAGPAIRSADVAELHISCGDGPVALVKVRGGGKRSWDTLAGSLLGAGFAGVAVEPPRGRGQSYGSAYTCFELEGMKYTVSPASFFQSNWQLNRALVRYVIDTLGPMADKTVQDLYSGAGNFALPLSMHVKSVVAVEENPSAVEDGIRNAKMNGIANCRFVRSGVDALKSLVHADVLVLDPPRAGLTEKAVDIVMSTAPINIVYVSCNPSSFARDLKKLSAAYELLSVSLVDFFPQTYHIESVAFLRLRTN